MWLFESQVLGTVEFADEESSCGMPTNLQVDRLVRDLEKRSGLPVSVTTVDLNGLDDTDRDVALDAVVAGAPSPIVVGYGRVLCTGTIDPEAVYQELTDAMPLRI